MDTDSNRRLRAPEKSDSFMTVLWVGILIAGALLCLILLYKVIFFRPDEAVMKRLTPQRTTKTVVPNRGDILDCNGRILATTTKAYDVFMDCKVQSDTLWNNNVKGLADGLAAITRDKSGAEYLAMLQKARKAGTRYLPIKKDFTQLDIIKVRQLPIFNQGKGRGGYIEKSRFKRLYPYGSSARRTIGYVSNNEDNRSMRRIGIEGSFDEYLHGTDGVQMFSTSDFGQIPVNDSANKRAVDGKDVRLTIDIDIQNIADEALRKTVEKSELIEKACVIVLETKTGAVKAMVNLGRDKKGNIGEWDNYAVRTAEAPGSIFKSAVVLALLEDGYLTSLDHNVPTFGGHWSYNNLHFDDTKHLSYARFPSGYIKVKEAFEMSANNPFRQLICDTATYGLKPERFINRIKSFGLMDTLVFDLKGTTPPFILEPNMKKMRAKGSWDGGTFPRMAIGYNMEVSPLNLVNFYNAVANDGKMMKPYLVEAIMKDGSDVVKYKPEVLHESICTKENSGKLKEAMSRVTSDKNGTAYWQLHDAVCPIAGKTGTAQRLFRAANGKNVYKEVDPQSGRAKESQQGSFVGFFPVDNPKYTAIVVVWNEPSFSNFYGAVYAAPVFKEIADKIYCLNED